MIYLISSIILVSVFLLFRKFEEKQNFCRSFIMSIVTYECYLCFIAGIMTVCHIPVDIYSVSIVNILLAGILAVVLYKRKCFQKYYINLGDAVFLISLALIVFYIFVQRFTLDLHIIFETSDPGVHLKLAMNFVNSKKVEGMYIGQLINGLFIESLMNVFSGEMVYKSFIIQCGINFFVAGAVFWAVVQKYGTNHVLRLLVYLSTLIYLFGYPYNDFLYGFVYLQMAITVVCYIIGLTQDFRKDKVNIWFWGLMAGTACLGVSIGYTLFAPPVFIGIFAFVMYKAYQEKWLMQQNRFMVSKRFLLCTLNIFLLPTFLTIWIVIVMPKINGNIPDYGNALSSAEGSIYRNLFSDFLLYIIPAVYGIWKGFKKKLNFLSLFYAVFGIYYLGFLFMMLSNRLSTYYFYKLNYLLWMLIIMAFVIGIGEIWKKEKALFVIITCGMLLIGTIYFSGVETKYQEKNINYLPYADASVFFRVFTCNKMFEETRSRMPKGLVEVSGEVLNLNEEEPVVFVGNWQHLFWFEALTNQRFEGLHYYSYSDVLEYFKLGGYGKYAVVMKKNDGIEAYQQYLQEHAVFESKYAYLIER